MPPAREGDRVIPVECGKCGPVGFIRASEIRVWRCYCRRRAIPLGGAVVLGPGGSIPAPGDRAA